MSVTEIKADDEWAPPGHVYKVWKRMSYDAQMSALRAVIVAQEETIALLAESKARSRTPKHVTLYRLVLTTSGSWMSPMAIHLEAQSIVPDYGTSSPSDAALRWLIERGHAERHSDHALFRITDVGAAYVG